MPGGDGRKIGTEALRYAVLAVFVVLLAFPFYWMFVATFKQNIDLYNVENNPFKFNLPPTLDHLKLLFVGAGSQGRHEAADRDTVEPQVRQGD